MVTIFKTSIPNKRGVKVIEPLLKTLIPDSNWNFDLNDCDKIFRVEKMVAQPEHIIQAFNSHGFECEELQ